MTDPPAPPQHEPDVALALSEPDAAPALSEPPSSAPAQRRSRLGVAVLGLAALGVVLIEAAWIVLLIELSIWLVRTLA